MPIGFLTIFTIIPVQINYPLVNPVHKNINLMPELSFKPIAKVL